jgi:hypothetical protein
VHCSRKERDIRSKSQLGLMANFADFFICRKLGNIPWLSKTGEKSNEKCLAISVSFAYRDSFCRVMSCVSAS